MSLLFPLGIILGLERLEFRGLFWSAHLHTVFAKSRYADIISKAQERHQKLEESIKQHGMLREVKEVESWIQDKVCIMLYQLCNLS